ncbi:hypothetical protein BD414DRAFT_448598 [Trametes punicea]|nr:hypothetical protein BD414DRAFT_448598 [Trametes punicea]
MAIGGNYDQSLSPVPPYKDISDGDIVIRTSDNVDFHVPRLRLAALSPVLDGALPSATVSSQNIKPSVNIQETRTSAVWEKFLRIVLLDEELPYTLDNVSVLVETGRKYGIAGMATRMRYALLQPAALDKDPVRVYLMASTWGLRDVAQISALRTLALPSIRHDAFDALSTVSGVAYQKLLDYREECGRVASAVARLGEGDDVLPGWIASKPVHWNRLATKCPGTCAGDSQTVPVVEVEGQPTRIYICIRRSWMTYLETLGKTLLYQPRASLATSPELLEPVVTSALHCQVCMGPMYSNLVSFSRAVESEIEKAVSEIHLLA